MFDLAGLPADGRYLDVGCGRGSLNRVVTERARPELLVGIDPSASFLDLASVSAPLTAKQMLPPGRRQPRLGTML